MQVCKCAGVPSLLPSSSGPADILHSHSKLIHSATTPLDGRQLKCAQWTALPFSLHPLLSPFPLSISPFPQPPANDPRATPITSWVVRYRTGSSSAVTEANITTPSTREYPLSNLMKGTLYMVSLAGVNSAGLGSFTAEESQRTMFDSEWSELSLQCCLIMFVLGIM